MLHLSSKFTKKTFKVGSRNSLLALTQTNKVISLLKQATEDIEYVILTPEIITSILVKKEIPDTENMSYKKLSKVALNLRELDIIVHSMKDVSTKISPESLIGCICLRDDCEDVVVMRADIKAKTLEELPPGSFIGTSSKRRVASLKMKYPQHELVSIKGDLDKRIHQLDNPNSLMNDHPPYSALILAKAGLVRLNLKHRISQELPSNDTFYAVGQGALACECRRDDIETLHLLSLISDEKSTLSCVAEKSLVKLMKCKASDAVSVQTVLTDSNITLKACVSNEDGSKWIEKEKTAQLPTKLNSVELEDLESKESLLGISMLGFDQVSRHRIMVCKQLGENVADMLLSSNVNEILKGKHKEHRKYKKNK